jgi:diadenosine tetraphosphate (Ap4A) HIT family hydrolase
MPFILDSRIAATCFELGEWPLSRVVLKNNANFPWLILIPRMENIQEIDQLPQASRYILMDEISQLSTIVRAYFKPNKINIGSLGNIVSQLHVHVIGRFTQDNQWPYGVWQKDEAGKLYEEEQLQVLIKELGVKINDTHPIT